MAEISGAEIKFYSDPKEAVDGANVVTTDTWVSMGQEGEKEQRLRDFRGFMVDSNLMSLARRWCRYFYHCPSCHIEATEVSEEVFEDTEEEIFLEDENRSTTQGDYGVVR